MGIVILVFIGVVLWENSGWVIHEYPEIISTILVIFHVVDLSKRIERVYEK